MKMTIRTRNRGRHLTTNGLQPYKWESTTPMGESGYSSVTAMQKELRHRFPNDTKRHIRNRNIKNGIVRIEGPRNHRMVQVITLE